MLDIKLIRTNKEEIERQLKKRSIEISLDDVLNWDTERRKLITEIDNLRAERKNISKGKPSEELQKKSEEIREKIKEKEKFLLNLEQQIEDFLLRIPNIPDESVPVGKSSKENKIVRTWGEQKKFNFEPAGHWEIGQKLDILDFSIASKISGTRFALLKGKGAALERALITFMLDLHIKNHGYTEIFAPYLVNKNSITGTGQLPKFEEEVFKCRDDELYLIPTAEVSVTNIHRDEILDEKNLPLKYVSYSACFRREAGSYGKDTKGLIRNHQFNKIELVKFTKPEESMTELEKLTNDAEEVLKKLGLTYRVVELCTGDLGFASSKTYDLEVWMPGEKMWREVSSCSNFKDFQSRRMNIKFKREDGSKEYVHTINGSGLAVGRTFAAILENFQNENGSVNIPEVLWAYLDFKTLSF